MGDIVLTTPVIRCLKKQLNAEVHLLTQKRFFCLLENNPHLHHLHAIEEGLDNLKTEGFDLLIDLHHNLRSATVKKALGVPSKSYHKLNFQKWLLTTFKINRLPKQHIVDRYLETVSHLGVKNDCAGLDFFISPSLQLPANFILPKKYVALVIGGQHATKLLPLHKLQEVCQRITDQIVLVGGPEDEPQGAVIAKTHSHVLNSCGVLTIQQSAYVLQHSERVITHDTGMMHIAAALQKKIVSIWGNTVPEFGMYPYVANDQYQILEVKNLSCRPCSKIGYKKCPKGHFKCMNEIDLSLLSSK